MLIFLDIDGVLVRDRPFDNPESSEDLMKFDRACLHEFETVLRRHPDARVVIASSWREVFPFAAIPPLFSPDIAPRIAGSTPFLDPKVVHQFEYLRDREVLEYLRQNHADRSPWVAVDDIREHYPPDAPIVVTVAEVGFDRRAAKVLSEYLELAEQV
ncbi:MAG: HAD domain-containing protein [Cyanobacteriota bacterium]|nr:HAD domain-containing protein [Cyanobacteriota bacterium]